MLEVSGFQPMSDTTVKFKCNNPDGSRGQIVWPEGNRQPAGPRESPENGSMPSETNSSKILEMFYPAVAI